ncbi:pseudouridine synthase [Falsirhodobacter deserti]|uniref:pseudouridine synthase n=1 Tax=Falsirhodobacter deserti TaxID=1365611 RepID=UPI000FE2C059|nr:pseudouridine synthase [Falsirhodobacter deserti]
MSFVYSPPDVPLRVIHADARIVVADKPSGLLSVPGRGDDRSDCLIARLRVEFPDILLIHRLDLDTSGVMIFARDKPAQGEISQQFEKRLTKKVYQALLDGRLEPEAGRVDLPLIVDWPNRPRQHVNHETGKPAQTDWQVIAYEGNATRVHLMPVTGRSHQLRVHMMETGHAILGDPLYASGAAKDHPRLMLHAETLRIRHPDTGRSMTFAAPVPF